MFPDLYLLLFVCVYEREREVCHIRLSLETSRTIMYKYSSY